MKIIYLLITFLICFNLFGEEKTFEWKKIEKAFSYKIELCADELCNNKIFTKDIKELSYKQDFRAGTYYFRLAPVSETGLVSDFTLAQKFEILPEIPVFITPKNKEKFDVDTNKKITFEWSNYKDVASYVLELQADKKKPITIELSKNSYELKEFFIGTLKFRVKSTVKDLSKGFSEFQELSITKEPPVLVDLKNDDRIVKLEKNIQIKWQGKKFEKYAIRIDYAKKKNKKFKQLLTNQQTETKIDLLNPKLGFYKVYLTGFIKSYQIDSEPVTFEIVKKPPAPKVVIAKYSDRSIFFELEGGFGKLTTTTQGDPKIYRDYSTSTYPSKFIIGFMPFKAFNSYDKILLYDFTAKISYQRAKVEYPATDVLTGEAKSVKATPMYLTFDFYEYFKIAGVLNDMFVFKLAPTLAYEYYNLNIEKGKLYRNAYYHALKIGMLGRLDLSFIKSDVSAGFEFAPLFLYKESPDITGMKIKNKFYADFNARYSFNLMNSVSFGVTFQNRYTQVKYESGKKAVDNYKVYGLFMQLGWQ